MVQTLLKSHEDCSRLLTQESSSIPTAVVSATGELLPSGGQSAENDVFAQQHAVCILAETRSHNALPFRREPGGLESEKNIDYPRESRQLNVKYNPCKGK